MFSALGGAWGSLLQHDSLVLVDVGSAGGIERRWRRLAPHVRVVTFEPDDRAYSALPTSPNTMNFPYALGDCAREVDFLLMVFPPASSIFEPDLTFLSSFPNCDDHLVVGKRRLTLRTLTEVLVEAGISEVDFIKLDTQGADLMILKGAEPFLRSSIFGIQTEVEFNHTYKGRPSFGEIDSYLRTLGFQLFDLRGGYWKRTDGVGTGQIKGQLIWADALYLRTMQSLVQVCRDRATQAAANQQVVKAILITLLHGYSDYAMELCKQTRMANLIPEELARKAERFIRRTCAWRFRLPLALHPTVFGKVHRLTARLVWKFYQRIRPHWREFAITDLE